MSETIVYASVLVAIAAIFGAWGWDVLGTPDEGYPLGRVGRFMHLLVACSVVGIIVLCFLSAAI
jgi:hypothetical protein